MSWLDVIEENKAKRKGPRFNKVQVVVLGTPKAAAPAAMYTGAGPDGVVQPQNPVAMDYTSNPPTVVHEGEMVQKTPYGKYVTPASAVGTTPALGPASKMVMAQTPQQQATMKTAEQSMRLPGRATGGPIVDQQQQYAYTSPTLTIGSPLTQSLEAQKRQVEQPKPQQAPQLAPVLGGNRLTPNANSNIKPYEVGQVQAFQQMQGISQGRDPYMNTVANRALDNYDAQTAVANTANAQKMSMQPGATEGAKNLAVATLARDSSAGRADLSGKLAENAQGRMVEAAKSVYQMGRDATQDEIAKQQWEKTFGESQRQFDTGTNQWQQTFDQDQKKYADTKAWTDFDYAAQYGSDQDVIAAYKSATGKDLDPASVAEIRGYARSKRAQDIQTGDLTIEGLKGQLGDQKFNSITSRINAGASVDQINQEFGEGTITPDQYSKMFAVSETGKYQEQFGWAKDQFGQTLALDYAKLASNESLTREGLVSSEKLAGLKIASDEKIARMQIESAQKLAADENFLRQQGVDLQKAGMYGYTDPNGNHVKGSMEIAADTLGLQKWQAEAEVNLADKEFGLKLDQFAEAKRAAQAMEGLQGAELEQKKQEFQKTFGLEYDKFQTATQQWATEMEKSNSEFAANYSLALRNLNLDENKLSEAKRAAMAMENLQGRELEQKKQEFQATFGLESDKFNEAIQQSTREFNESHDRWLREQSWTEKIQNANLSLAVNEQAFQRDIAYEQLGIQKSQLQIQQANEASRQYWDASEQFSTYAMTHIDATDDQIYDAAKSWYKAQTGKDANVSDPKYQTWAKQEWDAAKDSRLTNPIDKTIYTITSSTQLDDDTKQILIQSLKQTMTDGAQLHEVTNPDGTKGMELVKLDTASYLKTPPDKPITDLIGNSNDPQYQDVLAKATTWSPSIMRVGDKGFQQYDFTKSPAEDSVFKVDGNLYQRGDYIAGEKTKYFGFKALNLATGQWGTFSSETQKWTPDGTAPVTSTAPTLRPPRTTGV